MHLTPNLILAFLVAWAIVRGAKDALWATAVAGTLVGLSSPAPLGLALLAFLPLVPLAALRELRLLEMNFLLAIPVLIVETLLYFAIMLMGLTTVGDSLSAGVVLTAQALPTLLGSLLVFPLVYWLTSAIGRPEQIPSPTWGSTWGIRD
jgi:rod shape-determining protein MreD